MSSIREFITLPAKFWPFLDDSDLQYACFFIDNKIYFLDGINDFYESNMSMDVPSVWEIASATSGL